MLHEVWSDLRYRLRALLRRDRLERELADELHFHIEREADKLERLSLHRDEALRRARVAFGGVERMKEESRDARGTAIVETTLQDLRYAVRGLRARPGFTVGVVLTIGLSIGANAAMFGIVDRLLFRPPAYLRAPDRVHRVYLARGDRPDRVDRSLQVPRYLDFVRWSTAFSSIAAFDTRPVAVGDGERARELTVTAASASYFDLFDARPVLGRFFSRDEDRMPEGSPVVVLGYAYWQAEYGGRADAIGRTLRVGRTLCTIIGVAPPRFAGMADQGTPALYMPVSTYAWNVRGRDIRPDYDFTKVYGWFWLQLVVERKPGVSLAAATADLTSAYRKSWMVQTADQNRPELAVDRTRPHALLEPVQLARGPKVGADTKVLVWVSGVALIVLLIACANVANLLLARATTRRREVALRLALGVSRGRLLRQLLTESLLLAALGGAIGIALAQWGGGVLRALFLTSDAPAPVITDTRTLLATLMATLATALLSGFAPAAQALRSDASQALNAGGRDAGARPSSARTGLLLFQAALSFVLLVGAGLFVRSLQHARGMRLGFDVDPVLVVSENFRGTTLTPAEGAALETRLTDEVRAIPGVVAATPSPAIPFESYEGRRVSVAGIDSVEALGTFFLQAGNADYFRTFGTRILRGRAFDDRDGVASPRVVVVSDRMANALWPGQDPLGKCIRLLADTMPCTTVVGVAEEMHTHALTGSGGRDKEYTYTVPIQQYDAIVAGTLMVRVSGNASDFAETVRYRLQRIMPGASYVTVTPLRNELEPRMRSWHLGATMFAAFASLALVLAGVGLYSVIAYGVAQRRKEIGVRIALGASAADMVRLVVQGGVTLVVAGVVIGSVVALWSGRWIGELLFDHSPYDPVVYGVVAAVLILVALVATAIPAVAAARVDPNVALRAD